jgi:hypothetical protein
MMAILEQDEIQIELILRSYSTRRNDLDKLRFMYFSYLAPDEIPKILYHYTSLDALVSIAQTKRLRASNIRFLNDRSESLWLKEHALAILRKRAVSSELKEFISGLINSVESNPRPSPFVASFSESCDLLSQWRAYCPSGLGVSIGLSSESLQESWIANPRGEKPFYLDAPLQKARYYGPAHEDDLEHVVDRLIEVDRQSAVEEPKIGFPFKVVPLWLQLASPFFKHEAFNEECEWRKVISKHGQMPGQKFRQGKSTLIPFVEIMLDVMRVGTECVPRERYFINEVVVGPTPTPDLTIEALRSFFDSEGHPEVTVRSSTIPFRDW